MPAQASLGEAETLRADLHTGFGDRYELGETLGQGGFGSVYRARDTRLNRTVAIKATLAVATAHDKLLREARALAQLRHPGIVAVYDVAVAGKHCFVVSELLPGPSLADWLHRSSPALADALSIAAEIADALAHCHARSIVHRDIKPSNIVFGEGRKPVVVDFGLALTDMDSASERGRVSGTPAFMAPEQALGQAHRPDGRTDIYGLAATLYAMLCGRPPFRGQNTEQVLQQVREDEPQPPRQLRPELPQLVEQICLKGLAKLPADRYTTAADFAQALRSALDTDALAMAPLPVLPPRTPQSIPTVTLHAPASPVVSPASIAPNTTRSERRQVTLLGCTCEAGAGEEEDDPFERVTAFQAACRDWTLSHGGIPIQTSGTSFLACFGYPVAHEDAPRQALHTALALCRIPKIQPILASVGSGAAVITESAGAPPVVVGDVTTATNALTAQGGSGVLATDATAKLVAGFFDIEPAGEIRGRGSSTTYHRVKGERQARGRLDAADPTRLSPLIGRGREVELMRERWEQAVEGMRNVILLVADPGIGKSRLIRVLRDHILPSGSDGNTATETGSSHSASASIVEWYCSAHHAASPYYPVIDYFDRAYLLTREPDPVRRLDRLLNRLRADGVAEPEDLALFAAMLSIPTGDRLPPLSLSPERQKEKTRKAIIAWLNGRAERVPVLFVVEDLHWVDPSTEALLGEFVERGADARILGLFTFRPEYDPPWKGKAVQTQVALNRLTRGQVTEMVRSQTAGTTIPSAVVDQIVERTDGVPLFVEEFARLLADGAGVSGGIPTTLQDLLLARLDRMASVREVVQLGAAIGRTFAEGLLRASTALDEMIVRAELDKLVGAGLLFPKGSPPRVTYTFKHALIQEAAYQSLVKKQRQSLHRAVAEALEREFPDIVAQQPEVLAHHFTEAGELPRAVVYWSKAGQSAREKSAHPEAIRHLTRGLELLLKGPPGLERDANELPFRMMLAASSIAVHGYASVIVEEHIQTARSLCERLGSESPLFHVMMIIWAVRFIRGQSELAEAVSREIMAEAAARDDSYKVEAHWSGCSTIWWAGDFEKSLQMSTRGMELYTVESSSQHAAILQQNCGPLMSIYKAWGYWMLGCPDRAREVQAEALALADQLNDKFLIAATRWHSGFLLYLNGLTEETLEWMGDVIKASEEGSYAFWIALGRGVQGAALVYSDRPAEAVPLLSDALARCDAIGSGILHTVFLGMLADAQWALGRRPEAWATLQKAQEHNDRFGQRAFEAELLRRRARYLLAEAPDDVDAVEACLEKALAVARRQKARMFELRAALDLGRSRGGAAGRELVAGVFDSFTEGFETPDLIAARRFLDSTE